MDGKVFNPKILERERINDILDNIFNTSLFLVIASMGYGKTTAVQNYLKKRKNTNLIYFSASVYECDDIWLWKQFCRAVEYADELLGRKLNLYGFPKDDFDSRNIIELLLNNISKETVIVFDDWEKVKSEFIIDIIEKIAFENIPKLHIVLISRNMPKTKYIEYEIKRKCFIMWQEDLEFTLEDTKKLFEINGFNLNEYENKYIYNYASGWTTPTYLSLIEYSKNGLFKNIPKATKLIKLALYDKLDEDSINILLKLSLIKEFTLDQALYITEDRKIFKLIEKLCDDNFFVKYNSQQDSYSFHEILRISLNEEVKRNALDEKLIYVRLAQWYVEKNQPIHAIRCWYESKDYESILKMMEENWSTEYMDQAPNLIISAYKEMDEKLKLEYPCAYLTFIYCYLIGINTEEGAELLYQVKSLYEENEFIKNRNQILGEIAMIESFLYVSDTRKRISYIKKSYEYFQGGRSCILGPEIPFAIGSNNILSLYYKEQGKIEEIVEIFEENIGYFVHISNGCGTGAKYLIKAELEFERGNIKEAELKAYKALYKANSNEQKSISICAEFLLMRINLCKGKIEHLKKDLNELTEQSKRYILPTLITTCDITLGYINGLLGNYESIPLWIKENDLSKCGAVSEGVAISYISIGLAMILRKSYIELEIFSENIIIKYEENKNIIGKIYTYIYESIAKYNLYGIEKAKESMKKAIDIAKDDMIIMPFVELSHHILEIINNLEKNLFIDNLFNTLNKFDFYKVCKDINNGILNKNNCELTEREIEVMELLYAGNKQLEIASILNISLNTVRYHIKNIYDKFAVGNKVSAVKKYTDKYKNI
ncbi:response regulator transcription factor [Clostridium neonatale]|uniref:response regulator transcription factor n=1 Tax=Clostridium neonatale TaxID=137838 RepID=UPI00291B705D|nr:LuxR C-terminal-related transcriptional regulator [Clostridium neonatale]CAI3624971.1 LuxR family transcriptional regulator, maltose regulon positive regulatory protein [Clostridium neonatale]CAI3629524.1 LuxR family transcriptional regulator, maltose regulon positive regulatory protein [Clostridium neonatale]